jgi:hypothetical protein
MFSYLTIRFIIEKKENKKVFFTKNSGKKKRN